MNDQSDIKVLSDGEVDATEAMILAGLRWSDAPDSRVIPQFRLLMADYRRLRRIAR
jgi:hypothetical protein